MGKTAIVTGASRGLGLALVKTAKQLGYSVFTVSRHISEELRAEVDENCKAYVCDVTNDAAIENFRKAVEAETDHVDILLNNAGVWLDSRRLWLDDPEFDLELVMKQYDVNAVSVLRFVRQFLPLLKGAEKAVVINVSSEAGSITNAGRQCEYGYCMSKAAQNMATKLLDNAYPDIRFYAVHPGWMRTPQGFAGAAGDAQPQQEPMDTAGKLFEMAASQPGGLYYDITGDEMPW